MAEFAAEFGAELETEVDTESAAPPTLAIWRHQAGV
jgi:hypothetical protein